VAEVFVCGSRGDDIALPHRHLSLPASGGGAEDFAGRQEGDEVPELPEGFRVDVDEKGWRH
jgi:hypothetical protein